MHGINWGDLAAIVAVVGAIYGGTSRLLRNFKDSISEPLSSQMTRLSQSIDNLTVQAERERKDFDKRLDRHDRTLVKHDTEIGILYDKNGLERRHSDED